MTYILNSERPPDVCEIHRRHLVCQWIQSSAHDGVMDDRVFVCGHYWRRIPRVEYNISITHLTIMIPVRAGLEASDFEWKPLP